MEEVEAEVDERGGHGTVELVLVVELLWALQGSGPRAAGTVRVGRDESGAPGAAKGGDPKKLSAAEARRLVGLVPQTPTDLLYLESVKQERARRASVHPYGSPPESRATRVRRG
ncbi:hypothetical protein ACF1BA_29905 [Streptomyces rubiginosohelvolus]|uniref:hypothetical protein n=1 Tax=Streptomyces rubiginosohelvolus TaxID=67362 RepID=UPI0036F4D679